MVVPTGTLTKTAKPQSDYYYYYYDYYYYYYFVFNRPGHSYHPTVLK